MSFYTEQRRTSTPSTTSEADSAFCTYNDQYGTHYATAPTAAGSIGPNYQSYMVPSGQKSLPTHAARTFSPSIHNSIKAAQSPSYSPAPSISQSFDPHPQFFSSTSDSGASGHSTISSAMASPSLNGQGVNDWSHTQQHGLGVSVIHPDSYPIDPSFDTINMDGFPDLESFSGCVDPSLIEPFFATPYPIGPYPMAQSPAQPYMAAASPALSQGSMQSRVNGPYRTEPRNPQGWEPYSTHRSESVVSAQSHTSRRSSVSSGSEEKREICPYPGCKRPIRDLKAHILTHQAERPEKCPMTSCIYHVKGFARKYDKNRHTLTHFKGTMVCDFCPGSGSPAEKSFNRTDVFKRHLQSVHNVEQTATSSRRKKPTSAGNDSPTVDAPGICRSCGGSFPNAQALYDHIDECVIERVQQEDPSEGINRALLTSVAEDGNVKDMLARHNLPTTLDGPTSFTEDDMDADAEDDITVQGSH